MLSNSPPSSLFRRQKVSQAAADGMIILCRCNVCRHAEAYVATDLLMVYGDFFVADFGDYCRKCGRSGCVRSRAYSPGPNDVGRIKLNRPDGWEKVWKWRGEWLELPIKRVDETGKREDDDGRPGVWRGL